MKSYRMIIGVALAILLASCGPVKPTLTPPTVTSAVLPSATFTATVLPTATVTPVPPTATTPPTATATPTVAPTATPKPTLTPTPAGPFSTQNLPPIPAGMGAWVVMNYFSQELGLDIGGKFYKVPASSRLVIFLPPGRYTFSATIPGYAGGNGITDILENNYTPQDFYGS